MTKKIEDKYLYIPLLIFGLYFIYRLIDQSNMINIFPLDKTNDIAPYLAMLYFLKQYGYHAIVPYWQNGFVLFQLYPPGWFYFVLPLYKLTNNLLLTTYISLVFMFFAILGIIFYFNKKLSLTKKLIFFLFLFCNPISVGNFIRLSRVTELFGWMFFIFIAFLCLEYKDKTIDKKFLILFIPSYFFLMFSHPGIMVVTPVIIFSLFLVRKWKERTILALSVIIVLLASSFWWYFSFIKNLSNGEIGEVVITEGLLKFFNSQWLWTNIASFIVPFILIFSFYFYWRENKSKRELLFFPPILILNILFLTRLIIYIPSFNKVYPDIYMTIFLFFSLYYFLNSKFTINQQKVIFVLLIIISILSISISHFKTPYYEERLQVQEDAIEILNYADGKLFVPVHYRIYLDNGRVYAPITDNALYDYGIIYYNLNTSSNGQVAGSSKPDYLESYGKAVQALVDKNCKNFKDGVIDLEAEEIITFQENCEFLKECEFEEKKVIGEVCLFRV